MAHNDRAYIMNEPAFTEQGHLSLVKRASTFPSTDWLNSYLDLLRTLIYGVDLRNEDPRLVTSIPKNPNTFPLPVTINCRYILTPYRTRKGDLPGVALIFGPEFDARHELRKCVTRSWAFQPLRGEQISEAPFLFVSGLQEMVELDETYLEQSIEAAIKEVHRAKSSTFRRYHQPSVYCAATVSIIERSSSQMPFVITVRTLQNISLQSSCSLEHVAGNHRIMGVYNRARKSTGHLYCQQMNNMSNDSTYLLSRINQLAAIVDSAALNRRR